MSTAARRSPVGHVFRLAAILSLVTAAAAFTGAPVPVAPAVPHTDREDFALPAEALARVGSVRLRHGRNLSGMSYSPEGTLKSWGASHAHARVGMAPRIASRRVRRD
jgi:hypothetical protein